MLKNINRSDKTLRPFKTFKNWVIDTTYNENVLLAENGDVLLSYFNTSSHNQYYGSGALSPQNQLYTTQQYPIEGLKIDGIFYDTHDERYNPNENPLNWNNSYKRMIYSTIDHMFYKNSNNPLYTFGIEKSIEGKNGEVENRVIHDRVTSLNVAQQVYGQKIRPNTVTIMDYSFRDEVYEIKDDGYTNLKFNDVYFSEMRMVQPPSRSLGMENLYDVSHERFGTTVSSWGQYLLVGSPKDSSSLSDDKNGKAYLFRIETGSPDLKYRFIKDFQSPFTQNGFSKEQTWDYSDTLLTELGFHLLPEDESTLLDGFGESISISDNFMAIGSPNASYCGDVTGSAGQVFVYDKYKGGFDHWGIINILEGSSSGDRFGSSTHLSSSKLAIGAEGAYNSKGAVYIYQAYKYGDTLPTSSFWYKAIPSAESCFDVFSEINQQSIHSEMDTPYFITGDNVWVLQHVITSSEWVSGSKFGGCVRLNNERLFVGSKQTETSSSVYVFQYDPNSTGTGIFDTASFDGPTGSLAYGSGSWNKTYKITNSGVYSGSTFFTHSADLTRYNYFFSSSIYPTQAISKDAFGYSIDVKDNHLVIGSPYDAIFKEYSGSINQYYCGAAYIFNFTQSNWKCSNKVFGRDEDTVSNKFGISVSTNRDRVVVGSLLTPYNVLDYYNTSSQKFEIQNLHNGAMNASSKEYVTGETFIYKINTSSIWDLEKRVKRMKYAGEPTMAYGSSVSLFEDYMFVGSPINSYTNTTNLDSAFIRENMPYNYTGSTFIYRLSDLDEVKQVGNVFYKNGILTNTLTGSLFKNIFYGNALNKNDLFGYSMSFHGSHTIHENEVMCSVMPGEFNVSTNPTALKRDPILFDIDGDGFFGLFDAQLISQYLLKNYKFLISGSLMPPELLSNHSTATEQSGSWWKEDLILLESEDVMLLESWVPENIPSSSYTDYYNTIKALDDGGYLDVNLDGKSDFKDAYLIYRYFLGYGGTKLTKDCVDDSCLRRYEYQIREYLDKITGKFNGIYIREEFLSYQESSSFDKTGSYLAPFATQIGLYQGAELVAIGKLSRPIKISGDYPITFNVKYDSF